VQGGGDGLQSTKGGDDVIVGNDINTGANGICESDAEGNDTQAIDVGKGKANETCVTKGSNNLIDVTPQGDDAKAGETIHTGPNGICETHATAWYPSADGTLAGAVKALRDGYANTGSVNHNCYIDWYGKEGGNTPYATPLKANAIGDESLSKYILDNITHGDDEAHDDFEFHIMGVRSITTIFGSAYGTATQSPHIALGLKKILDDGASISKGIVHEIGHGLVLEGEYLHDDHTGGQATQNNCAYETCTTGGTMVCERHTKLVRIGDAREWENHDPDKGDILDNSTRDSERQASPGPYCP
jgi:hypothetical protein